MPSRSEISFVVVAAGATKSHCPSATLRCSHGEAFSICGSSAEAFETAKIAKSALGVAIGIILPPVPSSGASAPYEFDAISHEIVRDYRYALPSS